MHIEPKDGCVVIRGSKNPWKLAARIRKHLGIESCEVTEHSIVIVTSTPIHTRNDIEGLVASD